MPPPARALAARMAAALPTTNGLHLSYTLASRRAFTVTSGPIPAGSPMVMATNGLPISTTK